MDANTARPGIDWDGLPRLLQELCDGHPGFAQVVYRFDHPGGSPSWLCQPCFIRALTDQRRL